VGFRKYLFAPLLAAAACGGGTPSAPAAVTLGGGIPFQVQTRYSLTVVGNTTACGDSRSPQSGTAVTLDLMMQPDATGWTAAPAASAAGTLSLRFEQGPGAQSPLVALIGTARGFADDQGTAIGTQTPVSTGTRVTFGATGTEAVPLSGGLALQQFAQGIFAGTIIFSRNGLTSTCPGGTVTWTMTRLN
jgi:hypothetical protein